MAMQRLCGTIARRVMMTEKVAATPAMMSFLSSLCGRGDERTRRRKMAMQRLCGTIARRVMMTEKVAATPAMMSFLSSLCGRGDERTQNKMIERNKVEVPSPSVSLESKVHKDSHFILSVSLVQAFRLFNGKPSCAFEADIVAHSVFANNMGESFKPKHNFDPNFGGHDYLKNEVLGIWRDLKEDDLSTTPTLVDYLEYWYTKHASECEMNQVYFFGFSLMMYHDVIETLAFAFRKAIMVALDSGNTLEHGLLEIDAKLFQALISKKINAGAIMKCNNYLECQVLVDLNLNFSNVTSEWFTKPSFPLPSSSIPPFLTRRSNFVYTPSRPLYVYLGEGSVGFDTIKEIKKYFAPPLDYIEPERPVPSVPSSKAPAQAEETPAEVEPRFSAFTGAAKRLECKPLMHQPPMGSCSQAKDNRPGAANGNGKQLSGSTPQKSQGKLVFGSNANQTPKETLKSWVSLEYHGMDSSFSSKYRQSMAVQQTSPIQFSMSPYDYVNSLCPGSCAENNSIKGPSRSSLLTLPLDKRFKKWFAEGSQVNRFNALKYLAPDDSDETIMEVIQRHADLVQGLWVSKASVLGIVNIEALVRDYILLQFKKNALVHKGIEDSGLPKEPLEKVLNEVAVYRQTFKDWKFKEPTDMSFIKDYPEIVSEQERLWGIREKKIMETGHGPKGRPLARNPLRPSTSNRPGASNSANPGPNRSVAGQPDMVCSLQLICQGLRDLAVSKSTLPKADPRTAVAAAHGASAPLHELQSVISQVATNIHGVYVSKSSDDPSLNPLRSVVIDLFSAKESNAKLKKADIAAAAKIKLKREDINDNEYNQVLNELCVSVRGNAWMLKSGDGNQK